MERHRRTKHLVRWIFRRELGSDDMKVKMYTFHMKHDKDMNFNMQN